MVHPVSSAGIRTHDLHLWPLDQASRPSLFESYGSFRRPQLAAENADVCGKMHASDAAVCGKIEKILISKKKIRS